MACPIILHELSGDELSRDTSALWGGVDKSAEGKTEGRAEITRGSCARRKHALSVKLTRVQDLFLFLNISYRFLFLFLSPVFTYRFFSASKTSTHRKPLAASVRPPRHAAPRRAAPGSRRRMLSASTNYNARVSMDNSSNKRYEIVVPSCLEHEKIVKNVIIKGNARHPREVTFENIVGEAILFRYFKDISALNRSSTTTRKNFLDSSVFRGEK